MEGYPFCELYLCDAFLFLWNLRWGLGSRCKCYAALVGSKGLEGESEEKFSIHVYLLIRGRYPLGDALHPQQVPDGMPVGGVGNLMNKYQLDMVCRVAFWILVRYLTHGWVRVQASFSLWQRGPDCRGGPLTNYLIFLAKTWSGWATRVR